MDKYIFLALLLATPAFAQDQVADLRTAAGCGPAKTQFDVSTGKQQPASMQPDSGKALVFVIEQDKDAPGSLPVVHVTTRIGLDGDWVGANQGNSYLSFEVDPGDHRLCSDWQSKLSSLQKLSGAADLTAEAGKTYYFSVEAYTGDNDHAPHLWLKAVDDAEGPLLISKSALSTWKTKK
jgi:hypothetical protein